MIIVEGPDNAGKSTLVKQLMELDPQLKKIRRKRFNPRNGETIGSSYLQALINEEIVKSHGYAIADRMLASECIYGELFRDGCRMTEAEHFAIRGVLSAYRAMIIHCDAPDEVIIKSWKEREQLYDDPLIIARAYRERISSLFPGMLVLRYDWTARDADQHRKHIIDLHRSRQQELTSLNLIRNLIP